MAGGMSRRRAHEERETIAQRVANTRAREARQEGESQPEPAPSVRHAWYDGPHGRQAVLLLGWRNIQGRYDGRICVAVPEDGGWAIVEMWVDGAMLAPA